MALCRRGHEIDPEDNVPNGYACRQCLRDTQARSRRRNAGPPRAARRLHADKATMAVIRRFFTRVRITDGCWEWLGSKTNNGHGTFGFDGTGVMAHRFAYELMVGPVPEGLVLDHACRNRGCVRPDHLEPVTQSENLIRGAGNGLRRTRR